MNIPFVSCIMPTANREKYIPFAIDYFLHQNYPYKELVIVDDGTKPVRHLVPEHRTIRYEFVPPIGSIGAKRNYMVAQCFGQIIMHWDDDDWHASDWITKMVDFLTQTGADITGIKHVHYYSPIMNTFWQGDALNLNQPNKSTWLNGATLGYWKSFWKQHPFEDLRKGEDEAFVRSPGAKVFAHDYINGFVAILHQDNTTVKSFENPRHKKPLK